MELSYLQAKECTRIFKVRVIMTKVPEEFLELLPGNKLMQVLNSLPCIPFVKKAAQMILKNLIPGLKLTMHQKTRLLTGNTSLLLSYPPNSQINAGRACST